MFLGLRIFKRRQSQGHPSVGLAGLPEFLDHVLSIAYGIKQNDDGRRSFRLQRGWIIDKGFRIGIRSGDFSDLPQPSFRMPLHALLVAHGFRNMLLDPVHVVPGQACQRQFHLSAFLQFKGNFPAGGVEADKSRRDGFAGGIGPHARLVRHIGLLRRGKRQQHGREDRKQSGSHSPVIGCRPLAVNKIRLIAQLWAHPCSESSILAEAERSIQTATTAGNKFSYLYLNHFHGHYSGKETAK